MGIETYGLPASPTPLIGREAEVATATSLLRNTTTRLLTLTGPGGVGKTRLGLAVAERVAADFAGGVVFVPLAPIRDPALVASAIARALGIRDMPGRSVVDGIKAALSQKRLLLLLDNFEQVIDAAPLLTDQLTACPTIKMLVTSRAVLRLSGEHVYLVPPLALPDFAHLPPVEQLLATDAVRLFVARATAAQPSFALTQENAAAVSAICHRLDGLPLAIELAAVRVRLLAPAGLLARLEQRLPLLTGGARDQPARLQTMRDAIAWSYDLLTSAEQTLLRRLAVFVGGFTVEAAEAVANADGDLGVDVFDGVASLTDQSLLRQVGRPEMDLRFGMLETVREYGLERLAASGEEEATRSAHAAHFLALAVTAAPQLEQSGQAEWLNRLEAEHDNIRAAMAWRCARGEVEAVLRFGAALWTFWFARGHSAEGLRRLEEALEVDGEVDPMVRANALHGAGTLARLRADPARAEALHREELALRRALGDEIGIGKTLMPLGVEVMELDDYAGAETLLEEGVARLQGTQYTWFYGLGLGWLGHVVLLRGDLARARVLLEEALALFRARGDHTSVAHTLLGLGAVARCSGDSREAEARLTESLDLARRAGHVVKLAGSLGSLGEVAADAGDYDRAEALLAEAVDVAHEHELVWMTAWPLLGLGRCARLRGDHGRAMTHYAETLARLRRVGTNRKLFAARCLEELAAFAVDRRRAKLAARLLGAAAAVRRAIGAPLPRNEQASSDRMTAATRAALGVAAFAAAYDAGRELTTEEAIAEALADFSESDARQVASLTPPGPAAAGPLTPREVDVLRLIVKGQTNQQIADTLFVSRRTVTSHVAHIFAKLGLDSRAAAAAYAVRHGLA